MLMATLTMHLGAASRGLQRDPAVVLAAAAETAALLLDPLDLPDGLVVVSPSPALHELPWALLPDLHDRPFVVAPSAGLWRRCRARPPTRRAGTLVVCGPGLPLAEAEGGAVAACYADATLLVGERATVGAVEEAMRRVDVAHLVCHGSFSSGNPMFSSLRLADGPMFVYDLERLSPPPNVVVLSACSAGIHATPAGKEILGLTASLLATGPRAVIAATVAVLDALVDRRFHERAPPSARRRHRSRRGAPTGPPGRPDHRRGLRLPWRGLTASAAPTVAGLARVGYVLSRHIGPAGCPVEQAGP